MTRSKRIKRRHVRKVFILWMKEMLFNTTVGIVLAATILLIWRVFNPAAPFSADAEAVAALRMPPQAMSNLSALARWHDVPFDQVLAIYAVSNNFFPQGTVPVVELDVLKQEYVKGLNRLRRKYAARDIRPYFELFHNLVREIEHFPISAGYEYMFSDTWGQIRGTAILDRKNIRGRIPVLSMTKGEVHQAGWHPNSGYHVVILTESGSRILYAHLDGLANGVDTPGAYVEAGQKLGTMGNSGKASERPVHLHIGISPKVSFAQDFWINPYPFLRYIENLNASMYNFPSYDHNN